MEGKKKGKMDESSPLLRRLHCAPRLLSSCKIRAPLYRENFSSSLASCFLVKLGFRFLSSFGMGKP